MKLSSLETRSRAGLWFRACACASMLGAAAPEPARPSLELRCELGAGGRLAAIEFVLRNEGDEDTAIVMGSTRASGALYLPELLSLDVTTSAMPEVRNFIYDNPAYPTLVGRIDPWVLSLPAQSTFGMRITADDFHFEGYRNGLHREKGVTSLRLRLVGRAPGPLNDDLPGLALWKVVARDLESDRLDVPGQCSSA